MTELAAPRLGQKLIKAGRSSGITTGEISSEIALMYVQYQDGAPIQIPGFEIRSIDQPSQKGDSGAPWMLLDPASGQPTGTLVGMHVGQTPNGRNSFACGAIAVFKRLGIAPAGAEPAPAPGKALIGMPAGSALRVMARAGVVLRAGPGIEFARLDALPFGAIVRRLGVERDWIKVDLLGDGAADGFVHSQFLTPQDASPP